VVFPGVEALDVAGPSAVFAGANRVFAARHPQAPPRYDIVLLATSVAPLRTSDGLTLVPDRQLSALRTPLDTLLVAGGPDIEVVLDERALVHGLQRLAGRARRVGSVCTGSFLLAAAGLLDGRRATTHWAYAARFAARFPAVKVDADAIYIRDGEVYTSAGVSAGMDLSMALVEADLGRDVALVARVKHQVAGGVEDRERAAALREQLLEIASLVGVAGLAHEPPRLLEDQRAATPPSRRPDSSARERASTSLPC
jgi:transcriptional regulator GlxA family with amidase domain